MIKSHSVEILTRSGTYGAEGELIFTFSTLKTITADVQPAQLTPTQMQQFGVTDLAANAKKMFFDTDSTILELFRATVDEKTYEIRGINKWPRHSEAILIPTQEGSALLPSETLYPSEDLFPAE